MRRLGSIALVVFAFLPGSAYDDRTAGGREGSIAAPHDDGLAAPALATQAPDRRVLNPVEG